MRQGSQMSSANLQYFFSHHLPLLFCLEVCSKAFIAQVFARNWEEFQDVAGMEVG